MRKRFYAAVYIVTAALAAGGAQLAAQVLPPDYIPEIKFNSGQDVVPSFDGWLRNPDGTFSMVFGYMNRNYKEELPIPPGPNNKIEPGPVDQGQPTYFLTRRHAWVFRVKVPKDWPPTQEVVWTITSHGRTEKAYGTLKMEEELLERTIRSRGNLSPGLDDPNKPPSASINPVSGAVGGTPVTLTALVTDDGLPKAPEVHVAKPEVARGRGQTNSAGARRRYGLSITWMEYRGPARVKFGSHDPIRVEDGKAVTTARFSEPGTYVLRVTASDGALSTTRDITIAVSPGSSPEK